MVGYSYGLGAGVYFDWNDPVSGALPPTEARAATLRAEPVPVSGKADIANAWECFADRSYFDMWCVRQVGERDFRRSFHLVNADEAQGLCDLLNTKGENQ